MMSPYSDWKSEPFIVPNRKKSPSFIINAQVIPMKYIIIISMLIAEAPDLAANN